MNPNQTKLRALLDDVLPASGEHHGPSRAEVLDIVRGERARHRRWHAGTALVAIIALLLLPSQCKSNYSANMTVAHAARKPAQTITIEHVNDEQLLSLLHGTPAALMEWPNGDRTLLVVQH